jgi:hypothetical protein
VLAFQNATAGVPIKPGFGLMGWRLRAVTIFEKLSNMNRLLVET